MSYRHGIYENPFGLTNMQRKTIQMVVNGYKLEQIAKMQGVTLSTVKSRMKEVRMKMDVNSTTQAAVMWVREVEFADQQVAA